MFKGLEHTALASPDPEKLAQWYVDHLEFRINYRYGGNVFVRAADGSMLEIIPGEGPRENQNLKTPGIRHLAVTVDLRGALTSELRLASARGGLMYRFPAPAPR